MKRLIALCFFIATVALQNAEAASTSLCRSGGLSQLEHLSKEKQLNSIVFFASWCASCRDHIISADLNHTAFVIAFDDIEAAEQALAAVLRPLNTENKLIYCFRDETKQIQSHYKVAHLPFKVSLKND